jgi:hypothetical protein
MAAVWLRINRVLSDEVGRLAAAIRSDASMKTLERRE